MQVREDWLMGWTGEDRARCKRANEMQRERQVQEAKNNRIMKVTKKKGNEQRRGRSGGFTLPTRSTINTLGIDVGKEEVGSSRGGRLEHLLVGGGPGSTLTLVSYR